MYSITVKPLSLLQTFAILCCYLLLTTAVAGVPTKSACHFDRLADVTHRFPPVNPKKEPQVKNVFTIFDKLRKMVGDPLSDWQLAVVTMPGQMAAFTTTDGVVVSLKAVQVSYDNVSSTVGDARMAFVLGHELAHLVSKDVWHDQFVCALQTEQPDTVSLSKQEYQDKNGPAKEAKADDEGFLYAARAGYAVQQLLDESPAQTDFFTYWQQQTQVTVDEAHATSQERAKLLRFRLRNLLTKLPLFEFGVRLSHFDGCADAIPFFKAFHQDFPAPENFNNIGYCEMQNARRQLENQTLATATELPYCVPLMLDVQSRLKALSFPTTTLRGEEEAIELLKRAQELFEKATQADPQYLPAWVNLAASAFHLKDFYEARHAIEKATRLTTGLTRFASQEDLEGLRAIIIYEQNRHLDSWPNAIATLETLASQPQATPCVIYNTVKLLEDRKRSPTAKYWEQLVVKVGELPSYLREVVCQKQTCPPPPPAPPRQPSAKPSWDLPLNIGTLFPVDRSATWQKLTEQTIEPVLGEIYTSLPSTQTDILTLSGFVEMVVFKDVAQETRASLTTRCGHLLTESRRVLNGAVYSCDEDWAALMDGEKVREVWVKRLKSH